MSYSSHVLSVEQMYQADARSIAGGISGLELMENAGQGTAAFIEQGWDICPVLVLCGPGNNGGDGYVIARALKDAGWQVTVCAFGNTDKLSGDARAMLDQYKGDVSAFPQGIPTGCGLIVDAIFGAGFKGDLPEDVQAIFADAMAQNVSVVSVDVPSGVDGSTGRVSNGTPFADLTVSFFRPKTGHLFYPGRNHTGVLEIIDIGIPDSVLNEIVVEVFENDPELWLEKMPVLSPSGHKYNRGHAAVTGGGMSSTGAARIAARAALRSGAGAVTAVVPPSALMSYSIALEAVMVKAIADEGAFTEWLVDKRIGATLIGPGNGVNDRTRELVIAALNAEGNVILDADALTVFQDDPGSLFELIAKKQSGQVTLTPHSSEFGRLFNLTGTPLEQCREAAKLSQAIVVLKGASTVVAAPDGRAVINTNAPPWLATAGSGDALAGIMTGLMAASDDCFSMASAAVWIHGETANIFGSGMIAEDIEGLIPNVLQELTG